MNTTSIIVLILIAVFAVGLVAYAILKSGKDEDRRYPYENGETLNGIDEHINTGFNPKEKLKN